MLHTEAIIGESRVRTFNSPEKGNWHLSDNSLVKYNKEKLSYLLEIHFDCKKFLTLYKTSYC